MTWPMPRLLRLAADVQHYAWGDIHFIPSLLGMKNPDAVPYAELWMGAHPELPSRVLCDRGEIPLDHWIAESAEPVLGTAVATAFDRRLPYLLKVLSSAVPLSIQAHPAKRQAEEGFARENAAGIPLSANHRNYKDDNHKPELIAALTDFFALLGFRPLAEIARVLDQTPEFRRFAADFQPTPTSLKALYVKLMSLPPVEVDSLLEPLVHRLAEQQRQRQRQREKPFTRADREYWILRADQEFSGAGHRDRGLFSIWLLNLVRLRPGEALYLPAGVLHAYLEGSGIEIMANSNNVLRGGLTSKHVDVPELVRNVNFEGGEPQILHAVQRPGSPEWVYQTPAREFELRRVEVSKAQPYRTDGRHSADLLIVTGEGDPEVTVTSADYMLRLKKGGIFLVPHGIEYGIQCDARATLYKATVPLRSPQVGTTNGHA